MRVAIYGFLIFAAIFLLTLPTAIPIIKTSADYSIFNTKSFGCSNFAKLLLKKDVKIVPILMPLNTAELGKLGGTLVIIGPNIGYSPLEANEVGKFIKNGGVLVIADDSGSANSLLKELNVKARFSSKELKDLFYEKRGEFPIIIKIEDRDLALSVNKIVLNVPAVIIGGKGEAFSSKVSIVGKKIGSYPVIAEMRYGKGRIIMISDPDIFSNEMFKENEKFLENFIDYIGSDIYYIDEAHHRDFNPYSISTVYIHKELDSGRAFQVFLFVTALAIFIESGIAKVILRIPAGKLRLKKKEIADFPDWIDKKILEKIIEEIKKGSKIGDINGGRRVLKKTKK